MSDMKVCTNPKCRHKGFPQKRDRFHRNAKKTDWRADRCKDCCRLSNTLAYARKLENDKALGKPKKIPPGEIIVLDGIEYKVGSHGFVFWKLDGEWRRWLRTPDELSHLVWMAEKEKERAKMANAKDRQDREARKANEL